ncbi:MAG: InlB B-repeat-containing protein, partial [Prevotella sp.]|nr:InlB B-repeat-containing protein [Prevotella sp.]
MIYEKHEIFAILGPKCSLVIFIARNRKLNTNDKLKMIFKFSVLNLQYYQKEIRMKILTLSFLTESKASHACLSSIRRVAITLLVMLLTTASAWAQFFPQTNYQLSLSANYQGGAIGMADVPVSDPTYTLTSNDEPTREGYMFCGWSTSSTGDVKYRTNDQITLDGNLTLYAVW